MKKLMFLLVFCALGIMNAYAQKTFSGTVLGPDGLGLPGVSVVEKANPTNGVSTDIDGKWTITVPDGKSILQFTSIGMKAVEMPAGKAKQFTMKEDSQMLGEVVVTGMVTTDKRLFTGASTKLKADDMKIEGLPDVSRSLEGRAAGVSVQNVSGTFGSSPKIRVRGATSIFGNSKPLWVVDGVIMEDVVNVSSDDLASGDANTLISSAIAGLNPDDIESFDVLKDGSATSIYGAKAMAGVIVITTKKGKRGKSSVSYQGSYTYRDIPRYSDFNIMNSMEEMSVYKELEEKGLFTVSGSLNAEDSGIYGQMYRELYNVQKDGSFLLRNDKGSMAAFLRKAAMRNTNWFQELFNRNIMRTHSVSFSSGTEKAQFYGSLSALVDEGWTKASNVSRYTGNFNGSFDVYDNLKLSVNSNASLRKQKAPGTVARDTDEVSGTVKRDFDINPYSFALNTSRTLDPNAYYIRKYAPFNILEELDNNYIDLNVVNLKFQTEMKWKVTPELEIGALAAMKYNSSTREHNITEFSNQANAYRAMPNEVVRKENKFLYTDPDNEFAVPEVILPKGGFLTKKTNEMFGYDLRATMSYKNVFKDRHTLNVYAGAELNSTEREWASNTNVGVQYADAMTPFYNYKYFKKGIEEGNYYYGLGSTTDRGVAFFSNVTYSLDRKYTINGTFRYEGSNRLGKSRTARWLPTWNISGSWNASEENFFESIKPTVSNLTLKASYSLTADRGPWWVSNSMVDIRSGNPWRPVSGQKESSIYIRSLENSELTYEKKTELNFGLNAGFLDDRINLSLDWYKRNNFDLIGPVYTQGLGGESVKYGNVASMKSTGLELSLSTTNIKTKDFSWTTSFVYSNTDNEITELESRKRVVDLIVGNGFGMEGYPVRTIFSIPFKGLNDDGLATFLNEEGKVTPTDVYLQNRDNVDFLEYSGSADPTDVGSLGNTFKYKNFELNVFATYAFGNVVRLNPVFRSAYNDFSALPKELADRWEVPGDEAKTNIPVIPGLRTRKKYGYDITTSYNLYNYSTARIAKGDFIRLKEVSLLYNLPQSFLKKIKVSRLSLKLQMTNWFLLYSDKKLNGQDPEFLNSGGVATPIPKQFTLTLNLSI